MSNKMSIIELQYVEARFHMKKNGAYSEKPYE
jgi:hypothetical protein